MKIKIVTFFTNNTAFFLNKDFSNIEYYYTLYYYTVPQKCY